MYKSRAIGRNEVRAWIEQEVSGWRSIEFVTLNFRLYRRTDEGYFQNLDEQTARKEIERFGKRIDRAVHGRLSAEI
jgi:hypothetical protein